MSMICKYRTLSGDEARRARADEDYLMSLTAPVVDAETAAMTRKALERMPAGIRTLLNLTGARMPKLDSEPVESGGGPMLDIHKSWHGLHWLLCQSAWDGPEPLRHAVLGGQEIGEDLGYGPARLVDAATVRAVAAALAGISNATLQQRFNPKAMAAAQIYAFDPADTESRDDFLDAFERVKQFFGDAAGRGDSVLIWLT
jgi:hypothetical protein